MRTLATQFDTNRLTDAVATPTCSSCCCCCCCLATSVTSSAMLAQRIATEGEKHQVTHRHLYTVLATLFLPITGATAYFLFWLINFVTRTCTTESYEFTGNVAGETYDVCTSGVSANAFWPLVVIPFFVLLFLYAKVRMSHPVKRAILVTLLIAVAFAAEGALGAFLILTTAGIGGIGYLIGVPIISAYAIDRYRHYLAKESSDLPQPTPPAPSAG